MPGVNTNPNDATATYDLFSNGLSVLQHMLSASQTYMNGISHYTNSFFTPYLLATQYFQRVEALRLLENPPADNVEAYLGLLENNIELMARSLDGSARMMADYARNEVDELTEALKQSLFAFNPAKLAF